MESVINHYNCTSIDPNTALDLAMRKQQKYTRQRGSHDIVTNVVISSYRLKEIASPASSEYNRVLVCFAAGSTLRYRTHASRMYPTTLGGQPSAPFLPIISLRQTKVHMFPPSTSTTTQIPRLAPDDIFQEHYSRWPHLS